jgi:succinate dehydrogenase/fumarate reductase flavoprotein subunit
MEHFREDYPLMDNENWLKWVIVRYAGDRMEASLEDIPMRRWKYRPEPVKVDRSEPRKEP